LQHGVNGSASVGYRQGRADRENAGINLNYRYAGLNIFGNYSAERLSSVIRLEQFNGMELDGVKHAFRQKAERKSLSANFAHQYKLGADWQINGQHTLGALFDGYHTGDGETRLQGNTVITPSVAAVSRTTSDSRIRDGNDGRQVNVNWQSVFPRPGQQLDVNLDYGRFEILSSQHNINEYFDADNNRTGETEQLRHTNPPKITLYSASADYAHPLGESAKIELGVKTGRSQTDNDLLYEIHDGTDWQADNSRSNHFVYTEQIHAAYASYSQTIGDWSIQAGLRAEYTRSEGEQRTTGERNDTTYLNLFPSLNVSRRYGDAHQFAFGYGRRISRPRYAQLNPFEIIIDAYSFTAGNPALKPVIIDNLSLTYMNRGGLMARLAYGITSNVIENVPVQNGNRYGMQLENFEKKTSLTAMLNYRRPVTRFWTVDLTVEGAYVSNTSNEASGVFENNGFMLQALLSNRFTVTPTLSAELTGIYVSPQKQTYFHAESMSNISLGVSKSLLKDKMSVSLTANDILGMFDVDMRAVNTATDYRMKLKRDTRWVSIGLRCSFGTDKVKAARRRTVGIEEETARAK
jgi:hypothetical protein